MAEIKLTKNELRAQQRHLAQLQKYLPTLQLKKAMLQAEIYEARQEIAQFLQQQEAAYEFAKEYSALLSAKISINSDQLARVEKVTIRVENIAGVDVPYFESIAFQPLHYPLFDTPPWLEGVVEGLRAVAEAKAKVTVAEQKRAALEEELRLVSIRVNLFEKILIPRAKENIKKIKIFLGDQELSAVSRAKVAKGIIEKQKEPLATGEL